MLTKARLLEESVLICVNALPPLPPPALPLTMKAIYMALDKHLDGEELWVVGYWRWHLGKRSGWGVIRAEPWEGRMVQGKGAEGRGQKA